MDFSGSDGLPNMLGVTAKLSLALAGLERAGGVRANGPWAASLGFAGVQLNAADAETRPRELSRSARRDIAAIVRREQLACTGVDLFVPTAHWADAGRVDHLVDAMGNAAGFAADLAALVGDGVAAKSAAVLSVKLPRCEDLKGPAQGAVDAVVAACQSAGVVLADHAWPPLAEEEAGPILVGLDPAAVIFARERAETETEPGEMSEHHVGPGRAASRVASRLATARLSDISADGRVAPGEGTLDIAPYLISLSTGGYTAPVVLDLRQVREQEAVAERIAGSISPGLPGI